MVPFLFEWVLYYSIAAAIGVYIEPGRSKVIPPTLTIYRIYCIIYICLTDQVESHNPLVGSRSLKDTTRAESTVTRRAVINHAAWTIPVIASAVTAPMAAASTIAECADVDVIGTQAMYDNIAQTWTVLVNVRNNTATAKTVSISMSDNAALFYEAVVDDEGPTTVGQEITAQVAEDGKRSVNLNVPAKASEADDATSNLWVRFAGSGVVASVKDGSCTYSSLPLPGTNAD